MYSASAKDLISTITQLQVFLSSITSSSTLYIDCEGNNLSRHGTVSIVTILVQPQGLIRLIDVLALGKESFTTASRDGKTLKSILESPSITKCFWDVRNDADALWALYQINIAGVIDIQLLENASRDGNKRLVHGLDKCVQRDLKLGFMELNQWIRTKKEIKNLMSADIFAVRPMDPKTVQYCANDIIHLPALRQVYLTRISAGWLVKAKEESAHRVSEAHSPLYEPQSSAKALGPWPPRTMEQILDEMEDQAMEDRARDMFGYEDDVGYYDIEDDWSDGIVNSQDAIFPEYWDSCWDKGGS
jgi:exonuclease 3'-5' domain-containing protein 1